MSEVIVKYFEDYIIYHYDVLESTNITAVEFAKRGVRNNTIILSDFQSCGYGRSNKKWESYNGNLYFSIVIRNKDLLQEFSHLSFLMSLAIGCSLKEILIEIDNGMLVQYKWPNDILINNKKISGILLESHTSNLQNRHDWIVIGVGVNISSSPNYAISLANCSAHHQHLKNTQLLELILLNFKKINSELLRYGFEKIKKIWMESAINLEKKIIVNSCNKIYEGIFIGISETGNLILKIDEENIIQFNTGEVCLMNN